MIQQIVEPGVHVIHDFQHSAKFKFKFALQPLKHLCMLQQGIKIIYVAYSVYSKCTLSPTVLLYYEKFFVIENVLASKSRSYKEQIHEETKVKRNCPFKSLIFGQKICSTLCFECCMYAYIKCIFFGSFMRRSSDSAISTKHSV